MTSLASDARLAVAHASATTLMLLRHPAYVVPTLLFPALFFLFFAAGARGLDATVAMCSFSAFAVIGVAFFQFGLGVANDRVSPWETYLRTLPAGPGTRVTARVLSAFVFGAAAAALVAVAAVSASAASLPPRGYAELALVLVASLVTFGLFGVALGYWTTPRSALPIANLLYLVLSYAGGLWMRPARLPGAVEAISRFLPTRWIAELSLGVARGSPWHASDWLGLAVFATVFAAAAIAGYRRDEGQRFR